MKNSKIISRTLRLLLFAGAVAAMIPAEASAQTALSYFPLTPCRAVDTRNPVGTNGGPAMGTTTRNFQIRGLCGVPLTAKAASLNITVTNPTMFSWLTIWPSGGSLPIVSTLNYDQTTTAVANGAIIGLSTNAQDLSVLNANGACHVIIDVTGYFE